MLGFPAKYDPAMDFGLIIIGAIVFAYGMTKLIFKSSKNKSMSILFAVITALVFFQLARISNFWSLFS